MTEEAIVAEDKLKTEHDFGWTWNLILRKTKEAGLTPKEVAERLGLSE